MKRPLGVNNEDFELAKLVWLTQKSPDTASVRVKGKKCSPKGYSNSFCMLLWERLRESQMQGALKYLSVPAVNGMQKVTKLHFLTLDIAQV